MPRVLVGPIIDGIKAHRVYSIQVTDTFAQNTACGLAY